jgi:SOS-response transcriptional repressor LexA
MQALRFFHFLALGYLIRRMKMIDDIRRENMAALAKEVGGVAALAEKLGRTEAQISQWIHGSLLPSGKRRGMRSETARFIEQRTGKPLGWLDTDHTQSATAVHPVMEPSAAYLQNADKDAIPVPVLANAASMGPGSELLSEDVVAGTLLLTKSFVLYRVQPSSPSALRFLHAYGDSMSPTLNSGDIVLVDTGITAIDIDGVYVLEAHGRLFIKRVRQRLDGSYEISSDNPAHKTVDVLDGSHEVRVIGRVLWAWNGRKM